MKIIAIIATYNEERFIAGSIEHLRSQGVDVYLMDNESTDRTVEIASRYLNKGVIGIETLPRRDGVSNLQERLARKEALTMTLDGDWFMHADADEIRLPPRSGTTLAGAIQDVDARGYNAVNFIEYTFIPTLESPDHDHPDFQKTMRWYYPFRADRLHRLNAWKRQSFRVDLATYKGHRVDFKGIRPCPEWFPMRHYLFLSVPHAARKYAPLKYDAANVRSGSHGWRIGFTPDIIRLPSQNEMRMYVSDEALDPSGSRDTHLAINKLS